MQTRTDFHGSNILAQDFLKPYIKSNKVYHFTVILREIKSSGWISWVWISIHLFIILFLHFFPSHSLAISFLNAGTSCDIHWEKRFWTSALLPPFFSITDKRLYKEPVMLITFYPEFPVYFNHLEFSRTTASLSFHTQSQHWLEISQAARST